MTPQQFINKWKLANLSERSAYQQHFLDLCELLDQPKPAEVDPKGLWYTFEKGVNKSLFHKPAKPLVFQGFAARKPSLWNRL